MSNAFWWAKSGNGDKAGIYAIGLGDIEVIVITGPDDTLAAQWARCCANALNQREREMNEAHADALSEQREAQQDARNEAMADRHEAMISDARDYDLDEGQ
jgi:hypothetical protein